MDVFKTHKSHNFIADRNNSFGLFYIVGYVFCFYILHVLSSMFEFKGLFLTFNLILACLIFIRDRDEKYIFYLSLLINISFGVLFILQFQSLFGEFFTPGRDDQTFFDNTQVLRNAKDYLNPLFLGAKVDYFLFLIINALYFDFLSLFDESYINHFHLIMLNAAVGSFINIQVYKILKRLFPTNFAYKSSLFLVFFPTTIFFYSILLRECWLMLCYVTCVYYTIRKDIQLFKKVVIYFVLFLVAFLFRPASSIFIILFPVIYYFLKIQPSTKIIYLIAAILISSWLFPLVITKGIQERGSAYETLILEESGGDSLGAVLISSSNPFIFLLSCIYLLFSPIPPPFVKLPDSYRFVLSIGAIWWYFIVSVFIICYKKIRQLSAEHKTFIITFVINFLFALVIVRLTSRDARHLKIFSPMIFGIATCCLYEFKRFLKPYLQVISIIAIVLAAYYFAIK